MLLLEVWTLSCAVFWEAWRFEIETSKELKLTKFPGTFANYLLYARFDIYLMSIMQVLILKDNK
jgi:hypothetical protein